MAEHYTIQTYDPTTKNGCSIPTLNPVTWGKLDEISRRYSEKYPDDHLIVTSMSRDITNPDFTNKKSAHNFGFAFDLDSEKMNERGRRSWLAQEAKKLGLWNLDEYMNDSSDKNGNHMHFEELDYDPNQGHPKGYKPTPYAGQKVLDAGQQPPSQRLGEVRTFEGENPFKGNATPPLQDEWENAYGFDGDPVVPEKQGPTPFDGAAQKFADILANMIWR